MCVNAPTDALIHTAIYNRAPLAVPGGIKAEPYCKDLKLFPSRVDEIWIIISWPDTDMIYYILTILDYTSLQELYRRGRQKEKYKEQGFEGALLLWRNSSWCRHFNCY